MPDQINDEIILSSIRDSATFVSRVRSVAEMRAIHEAQCVATVAARLPATLRAIEGNMDTVADLAIDTDTLAMSPADALRDLAARYWAFRCDEFPVQAILAGEMPRTDLLTRDSPADHERRAEWAARTLDELEAIPLKPLSQTDRATHALLRGELDGLVDLVANRVHLRPGIFLLGPEFLLSDWASSTNLATAEQALRYIARLGNVSRTLADVEQCLTLGREQGFSYPRLVVERTIDFVQAQAATPLTDSPFMAPLKDLAARGAAFDALYGQGEDVVTGAVLPALRAYADFLMAQVLPSARDSLACSEDLDGATHYKFLIRQNTTTDLSPEQVHAIGLSEVARISREMEVLAAEAGFDGQLAEFTRKLRTDNSQILESGEALREAMETLSKRIDARIPEFFGRIPRTTYGLKSIPEAIAAAMPPAYAQPNPADNSKAGTHWITSLPAKLPRYMHLPMALHEAWPGHLMHLALIQEMTDLPAFRRHGAGNYSVCLEGWALYCEGLGEDMGLYDTVERRYGRLETEMWRALRLVVDTGLHAQGWSREHAIDYFTQHVAMPCETLEAEIDRYIGVPGQALAYQIGNLKFRELRARAEAALGASFSLRAFNDALSSAGAVSLEVLEQTIDAWIEMERP